jgi:hypothetical protein
LFDRPLSKGTLPFSLIEITFGLEFMRKLEPGILPSSLQKLCFNSKEIIDLQEENAFPVKTENMYPHMNATNELIYILYSRKNV